MANCFSRGLAIGCLVWLSTQLSAKAAVLISGPNSLRFQAVDEVLRLSADHHYHAVTGAQPARVGDRLIGLLLAQTNNNQALSPEVHGVFDLTVGYTLFGRASSTRANAANVSRQEFVIYLPTDTRATHGHAAAGGILDRLPAGSAMALYQGGESLRAALASHESLADEISAATSGTLLGAFGFRANQYGLASQGAAGNGYWYGVMTEYGSNDSQGIFHERSVDPRTNFYYGLMSIRSAGGEFAKFRFTPSLNGSLPSATPPGTKIGKNYGTGRPTGNKIGFDLVGNWSFNSQVAPEPASFVLWGIGAAVGCAAGRRRRPRITHRG